MRKFKTLFGTAMLCVIMVSCDTITPPNPGDWNDAIAYFSPIALAADRYEYRTRDGNGQWTVGTFLPSHTVFSNFIQLFETPSPRHISNNSFIDWTVTRASGGHREGTIRRGQLRDFHSLDIQVFHETDWSILNQRLDLTMLSGPYMRRINGQIGNFIWTWSTYGSNYSVADVTVKPGASMDGSSALHLRAGKLGFTGRFVRIITPPSNHNPAPPGCPTHSCVCGALHNRPPAPEGQSHAMCDCMLIERLPLLPPNDRFLYTLEDSRFTEIAQAEIGDGVDWFRAPNSVVIMPVQREANSGTLIVFATEATYRQLVSR